VKIVGRPKSIYYLRSLADKETELLIIGDIYYNSALTIVAATSVIATEGFLRVLDEYARRRRLSPDRELAGAGLQKVSTGRKWI
jgi:hypothetical protein